MSSSTVIRLRGLPWSVTKPDIIKFLAGVRIPNGNDSVYLLTTAEGRLSGEAYVEVEGEEDADIALKHDNALMGQRYIEIFRSTPEQLRASLEQLEHANHWDDPIVRLRGLPFGCTKEDLSGFFDGLQIAPNGILMVIDFSGRFNGEAFVQFTDMGNAYKALDMHKKMMGHRYIEIFRTSSNEMNYYATNSNFIKLNKIFKEAAIAANSTSSSAASEGAYYSKRATPYSTTRPSNRGSSNSNRGGASSMIPSLLDNMQSVLNGANMNASSGSVPSLFDLNFNPNQNNINDTSSVDDSDDGKCVKMRGLPYSVTINDIKDFFKPLTTKNVNLLFGDDGRLSGEAEVEFSTPDDTLEAMKYDKKYIGSRYIELFMQSKRYSSRNNSNSYDYSTASGGSIPSLFDQMAYCQQFSQQFLNNNNKFNGSNRRQQFGGYPKRGAGYRRY